MNIEVSTESTIQMGQLLVGAGQFPKMLNIALTNMEKRVSQDCGGRWNYWWVVDGGRWTYWSPTRRQ